MKRSESLLEALVERGIMEMEALPAQSNVREHGVGVEVVGEDTNSVPMNPAAPVTNAVAAEWSVMWPVWSGCELTTTHNTRTALVRRPYSCRSQ
jgi:hypothetical protein